MKKILLIAIIAVFAFSSCKKDTLGVSTVTTYPTLKLKGDVASTITVGGSYSESGVVAMEGTKDISSGVKVTGTVNAAVPGVYTLTYIATNKDGFQASTRRYVGVVTSVAAEMDISGTYKRNAGVFGVVTVAKTKYPGLYINNNPGGAAVNNIFIYMFQTDVNVVSAPSQDSSVGEFACTGGVYRNSGTPSFSWVCINSGYGTAARTFIKQ